MREFRGFSLLLLLFSQVDLALSTSHLPHEEHALHSLKHVQKRHDIPLEFNVHSHEHSDIRRSARDSSKDVVESDNQSDKSFVRRDAPEIGNSQEVVIPDTKSIDKFDQPSYDFMLPEGKAEKQTILAVMDFITRKNSPTPKFVVTSDNQSWFDIGEIQKTKADNADVYKATVVLKEGSDVTIDKTENGLYKFKVEARKDDEISASTNVVVEVLNLAPTTKRAKVTVTEALVTIPTAPPTMKADTVEMKTTVTLNLEDPTTVMPDLFLKALNTSDEIEDEESSEGSDLDLTTTTTTNSGNEIKTSPEPSQALDVEIEIPKSSEESTPTVSEPVPEPTTETSEISTTTSTVPGSSTTPESTSEPTSTTPTPEPATTESNTIENGSGVPSESQESSGSSSEEEVEVEVEDSHEASGDSISTTSTSLPRHRSSSSSESSVELLTKSTEVLDLENPIEGPVTILPLKSTEEGKIEMGVDGIDASIEVLGSHNGRLLLNNSQSSKPGDIIRGVSIILKSKEKLSDQLIKLSIEPEGLLSIRPTTVSANEDAGLFINIPKAIHNNQKIEIVAKLASGTVLRRPLVLKVKEGNEENNVNNNKKASVEAVELKEIELAVMENAENGRTIGSVEGDMKIIGEQERFSLVGNDIILSCGQFDTDHCLRNSQKPEFTLMLLPRNGTLAPVQVTIRVQQQANLRTSDDIVRISDNRIIAPFAIITERTSKNIKLSGEASKFLSFRKSEDGLYQLIVVNSAASGKYELEIELDAELNTKKTVPVLVQNSLSHAHFRQSKYEVKIDAKSGEFEEGMRIGQVELEGVPIDEAKIMILDGNPGWVTVESYGGILKVGKYNGKIYNGNYNVRVGAVDIKTWNILTETIVKVIVENGEDKIEKVAEIPKNVVTEATFDREKSPNFNVAISSAQNLKIDTDSLFSIDENGKRLSYNPSNIKISKEHVEFTPESLKSLRIVGFSLKSGSRRESILLRLVSSPEYLENVRKNAARPVFPEPWTRESNEIEILMPEELKPGQVIGVFPAVIPTTNEIADVKMSGGMSEAFDYNPETGELKVRQRVDFESLSEEQRQFDLTLSSGDAGFKSEAILKIRVIDVDDNSPLITKEEVSTLSLPEDLTPGSKIAELDVTDPDGSSEYRVMLSGRGSENYRANITNSGKLSIFVAENAELDREKEDSHALVVEVEDVSKNTDRIVIPIEILDVNDNSPIFDKKIYEIEAIEDWPVGVVLEQVSAKDRDLEGAGKVKYQLEGDQNQVLEINETTGDISLSSEISGLARSEPYHIRVIASDMGEPSLNSTAVLNLKIRSAEEVMVESVVEFVEPKHGFILNLKENTPKDEKVYTVKAQLKGLEAKKSGATIEYSLKDLSSSNDEKPTFEIDQKSGDIFAISETPIDYEKKKEYTVSCVLLTYYSGNIRPRVL